MKIQFKGKLGQKVEAKNIIGFLRGMKSVAADAFPGMIIFNDESEPRWEWKYHTAEFMEAEEGPENYIGMMVTWAVRRFLTDYCTVNNRFLKNGIAEINMIVTLSDTSSNMFDSNLFVDLKYSPVSANDPGEWRILRTEEVTRLEMIVDPVLTRMYIGWLNLFDLSPSEPRSLRNF